jgi:hypothetical protein
MVGVKEFNLIIINYMGNKDLVKKIEAWKFNCIAWPLEKCVDWIELKNNINWPILSQIEKEVLRINDTFEMIENWEISPIVAYKYFRSFEATIKNALSLIENKTRDMVEQSPLEHKDFRISTRKTYDFNSSWFYNHKLEELQINENKEKLKEVEKLIKSASDMWKTLYDEEWVAIEPVEVKFNQILSYTPKNK